MADSFNVEKNTFYKTKEIDSDTSIKSYYPDSFDGKAINGDISNDANQIIYLANSKAPSIPMETVDPANGNPHVGPTVKRVGIPSRGLPSMRQPSA